MPYTVYPRVNASKSGEIAYGFQITPDELPPVYTPQGTQILANGNPKDVPANTVMDINRYQQELAKLSPSHQLSLLSLSGVDPHFGNTMLNTWALGLERNFGVPTGGFGFETLITANAHSSYNALQTSISGQIQHGGPAFQADYTWSKSIDDVSGMQGGTGSAGAVVVYSPQNPLNTQAKRGPSGFGIISKTAGTSRQIQISFQLIY